MIHVKMTDRARGRIEAWLAQSENHGQSLRLTLVPSHCMGGRGFTYGLTPDGPSAAEPRTGEHVHVVIAPDDAPRLKGAVIDFEEGLPGKLVVENPHTVRKCPCGHHDLFE